MASLSATNRRRSFDSTFRRSFSFAFTASGKNFSMVPVNLSPSNFMLATPFALNVSATLAISPPGFNCVLLNLSATPFTLIARTTAPAAIAVLKTPKSDSAAMSVTSTMGRPKRKSGLSDPYVSMASA